MSERENFARRLNDAMDHAGFPRKGMGRQSALVDILGTNHQAVKNWLEGSEFPPTSKLVKMATALGVRSNWLLSGQGDMVAAVNEDPMEAVVVQEASTLSSEAFEVASDWMRLPQGQREALRRVIRELAGPTDGGSADAD